MNGSRPWQCTPFRAYCTARALQSLCGTVLKATALTIFARSYGGFSSSDADTHTEPIWRCLQCVRSAALATHSRLLWRAGALLPRLRLPAGRTGLGSNSSFAARRAGPGAAREPESWPRREASPADRSDPWRVLDRAERPVAFQPCADRVVQHRVELRTVRAYPGTDGRIMVTRADAALAVAARRVDVHAADDFAGTGAEHGVGEPAAISEVARVAFEVAQIFRQAHRVWPAPPGESRCRLDVADAGRPCRIVRGVVLRPERFQPEFLSREPISDHEIRRNEDLITHQAMLAGRPSHHPAQPR